MFSQNIDITTITKSNSIIIYFKLKIYPNPFTDKLSLQIDDLQVSSLELINTSGQSVYMKEVSGFQINVQNDNVYAV